MDGRREREKVERDLFEHAARLGHEPIVVELLEGPAIEGEGQLSLQQVLLVWVVLLGNLLLHPNRVEKGS